MNISYSRIFIATLILFIYLNIIHGQISPRELQKLENELALKGATFEIGSNPATERPLEQLCGLRPPLWRTPESIKPPEDSLKATLPASFSWREEGILPPVRDQKTCGACWAFGTTVLLESAVFRKMDRLIDLSEQWLISCNTQGWDCAGGWWAHHYHKDPGAVDEIEFPYEAWDAPCEGPYNHSWSITDYKFVYTEYNVAPVHLIKQALLEHGPVTTGIYAGPAFRAYSSGVFNISEGTGKDVNHAVTIVGWDDNLGGGCWIVRNSWGRGWGEGGYMNITYHTSKVGYSAHYVTFTPEITFTDSRICDGINGTGEGNGNELPEPGETIGLYVTLYNDSATTFTEINAQLQTFDPSKAFIINNSISFDALSPGQSLEIGPYMISISDDMEQGYRLLFDIEVSSGFRTWKNTIPLTIHAEPLLYFKPTVLKIDVLSSHTSEAELIISNKGITDLTFQIGCISAKLSEEDHISSFTAGGCGGPDPSGYCWIESSVPGGPVFEWNDISNAGTEYILEDDEAFLFDIPFPFPFYGDQQKQVYISTNGFLTFNEEESTAHFNTGIPFCEPPNAMIAPLWCDLHKGKIFACKDEHRLIVQWDKTASYSKKTTATCQAILYENGDMFFQYNEINFSNISSVGIEDKTGATGLGVSWNQEYPVSNTSLRFSPPMKGLTFVPEKGIIAPGNSAHIRVILDMEKVEEVFDSAIIVIKNNDPRGTGIVPLFLKAVVIRKAGNGFFTY